MSEQLRTKEKIEPGEKERRSIPFLFLPQSPLVFSLGFL